ncbi:hypothetical protein, variant [Phialophora macrospora]|nr:hypothetical protein, variant [Phialophora macrospora]
MIMAFNVLLTVRTKRKATELSKIDLYAILLAFILPSIPALVFLCWRPDGKTVYGPATLWCWIGKEKDILRLWAFYVPIWCFILIAIFLFVLSGKQILLVRKKVKNAKANCVLHREDPPDPGPDGFPPPRERRFSSFARAFIAPPRSQSSGPTVTKAATTASNGDQSDPSTSAELKGLEPLAPIHSHEAHDLESHAERDSQEHEHEHEHEHDSSTSEHPPSFFAPWSPVSPTVTLDRSPSDQAILGPNEQFQFPPSRRSSSRFDRIHWKYAKFAFLCTIVLFITWVPISINRVYNNFVAPDNQIYGLYLTSAACMPLHGFGNFVIYTTTSWTECKEFLTCSGRRSSRRSSAAQTQNQIQTRTQTPTQGRRTARYQERFKRWVVEKGRRGPHGLV